MNLEELGQMVAPFSYKACPYFGGHPDLQGTRILLWPCSYEGLLHEDVVIGLVTLAGHSLALRINIQVESNSLSTHKVGLVFTQ